MASRVPLFLPFPCPFLIYQTALARRLESAIKYDILEQSIRMGFIVFFSSLVFLLHIALVMNSVVSFLVLESLEHNPSTIFDL
jgi:hypothetical protein